MKLTPEQILEWYSDYKLLIIYDRYSQNPDYTGDGILTSMVNEVLDKLDVITEYPLVITLNSELLLDAFRLVVKRKILNHNDVIIYTEIDGNPNSILFDINGSLDSYRFMNAHDDLLMDLMLESLQDKKWKKNITFERERIVVIPRYPRTLHLPFSMEVHKDDKVLYDCSNFINKEVIITEKLDGGNCCLNKGKVYARSTGQETKCPSFDFIKSNIAYKLIDFGDILCYGENLYAKHSIFYDKLNSYFFLFAVGTTKVFFPWKHVEWYAENVLHVPTVPILFRGTFKSIEEIKNWMYDEITKPSTYGTDREGFVIKITDKFLAENHSKCVAKFVRKGHVQTDEHWTKKWIPNKLIPK